MFISNIEALTYSVVIRVNHIPEDISDDFTITIDNDNNPTKIISVSSSDVNRFSNTYTVRYGALNEFTLSSLKIKCKYPVRVFCNEFTLGRCIVPDNCNERTTLNIINPRGDTLELEGTVKQIEAFEAERKERNDTMFPRFMSFMSTLSFALEHGLSVKKVTLNKKEGQ